MTYDWYDLLKFKLRLVFQSKTEHDLHWTQKNPSSWKAYLSCKYHFILNLLLLPYDIFALSKWKKQLKEDLYATEQIKRIFDEHR
jgi:ABC-type anion transport system duplicated permease subunit